jgi:hypothetical protein
MGEGRWDGHLGRGVQVDGRGEQFGRPQLGLEERE